MNYYKPTTSFQKIFKLIQLYWLQFRSSFTKRKKPVASKHLSILMAVSKLDRVGGLEFRALELSAALASRRTLITMLTDRIHDGPPEEFTGGFLIRRIPMSKNPTKLHLFFSLFRFLFRYRHSYQILHAHGMTGFTIVCSALAKTFRHPVVLKGATKDDFFDIFSGNQFKHRLYRSWLRKIDCFVAVSTELKEEMIRCGIPEAIIRKIPNFVDTQRFKPPSPEKRQELRNRFSVVQGQTVFLFVGRLEKRKGIDTLLQAWRQNAAGVLWIVGSGPQEKEWRELSRDWALHNVVFHGASTFPLEYYQAADVFVFPSVKEGSPAVTLEAMSCGLPCIATKIGGVVDQIEQSRQGLLVSAGSVEELSEALALAASQPEMRKRWSEEARSTATERFDIEKITKLYQQLYADLLPRYQ